MNLEWFPQEIYEIEFEYATLVDFVRDNQRKLPKIKSAFSTINERWNSFCDQADEHGLPLLLYAKENVAIFENRKCLLEAIEELENTGKISDKAKYRPARVPTPTKSYKNVKEFFQDVIGDIANPSADGTALCVAVISRSEREPEWGRFFWQLQKEWGDRWFTRLEYEVYEFAGKNPPY